MSIYIVVGLCGLLWAALTILALLWLHGACRGVTPLEPAEGAACVVSAGEPKRYPRMACEHCGSVVAVRRSDGMPHTGRHRCHLPSEEAVYRTLAEAIAAPKEVA